MAYSAKQRKLQGNIKGAKEIAKELKQMGESAKDILSVAANAGGQIALEDAKKNCPVRTGALKNSLKVRVSKQSPTKAEVIIEYDKSLKYGTFVELGARGLPANPFLRNAIDKNVQAINNKITEIVTTEVNKVLWKKISYKVYMNTLVKTLT